MEKLVTKFQDPGRIEKVRKNMINILVTAAIDI